MRHASVVVAYVPRRVDWPRDGTRRRSCLLWLGERRGDVHKALTYWPDAIKEVGAKEDAATLYMIGLLNGVAGRPKMAAAAPARVIEEPPGSKLVPLAYFALGVSFDADGRPNLAKKAYQACLAIPRREPQVAFVKPVGTDVLLLGHASAPKRGATERQVGVRVGTARRVARVVDDRRSCAASRASVSLRRPRSSASLNVLEPLRARGMKLKTN